MNRIHCSDTLISRSLEPLISGTKFVVVYCGNHQYKVSVGDVIAVQRLRAEIGSRISLKKVLMVGGPRFTAIGRPFLHGVRVTADVEEQKRMRNVVSLFATPGRRRVRWVDAPHAATIIRIREIFYSPHVVGELDKYNGVLQEKFEPQRHVNPVYPVDDGYDVFRKVDRKAAQSASALPDLLQEESGFGER
ncbi:putative Ribosomal prokaryotic L21 protein [Trypanosoma vivax]|uniref:Large ribosomal subunit protein bL21m n=1 Tax=Trypanosoma vivax (strain Y486) TaxID=1055687 RepID=G0TYN5_TRYVY|nr:hypothetical protein TRVL_06182 [Trypanosoma vivax]KAH8611283.1 putative Ribosomal prokaryotic L21 protein [Trypanosoma vivax]CCC49083.1 conserved hypothetical protein [Trypanosoma vivax Y486]